MKEQFIQITPLQLYFLVIIGSIFLSVLFGLFNIKFKLMPDWIFSTWFIVATILLFLPILLFVVISVMQ